METKHKPHSSLVAFILVFSAIAIVVGLAFAWLRNDGDPLTPITEHPFDTGKAIWTIDAYPAKVLHNNLFKIELTDLLDVPLQGAEIAVKLEMLDMVCGDYDFMMTEVAPGVYSGEGVPLMVGKWKATATLKTSDQTYTVGRLLRAIH